MMKTFTFLDESGALKPHTQSRGYYGIGILKHKKSIEIIERLHPIYEELCGKLNKNDTRVEFSFKSTTSKSIDCDLKFLDQLINDNNWEFNCLYFDVSNKNFNVPATPVQVWDRYVGYCKMLIKNNVWSDEETVVLADYQRKPKKSKRRLEILPLDIPQMHNILQTESHGVLLMQMVDLLLGGYLYSLSDKNGDKEGNKTRISQKVVEIQNLVGKNRFNCWEVDWSKSSRMGRV